MEKIIKATKREVLEFIRKKERKGEITHIADLMNEFGYKYKGAQQRIWRLIKSGDIGVGGKERGF